MEYKKKILFGEIFEVKEANNMKNSNKTWKVTFKELPTTMEMLKDLAEADLKEAHYAAALLIPALCLWPKNQKLAIEMINFLKGPKPLSTYEIQFINERLKGKEYLPFSYFDKTSPENGYKTAPPYTVTIATVPTSFDEAFYAKLYLQSSGADSPRPVQIREKDSTGQWFLWDQMLLSDIRVPTSQDPWA